MRNLERIVQRSLDTLEPRLEGNVAIAFSGGLDSTAMLNIFARILPHKRLRAIYVCHNLRPKDELEKEMALIQTACQSLHINLTIARIRKGAIEAYAKKTKCGIEAAARHYRYRALVRNARRWKIDTIVTAHHADDQLETFLMRLIRGGSLHSLAGIAPSRIIDKKMGIRLVRPLLNIERRELHEYALNNNLSWSEDSTNEATIFLRNRVRHLLIPYLSENFPSWRQSFSEYQSQIQDMQAVAWTYAQKRLRAMQKRYDGKPVLDLKLFVHETRAVRLNILRLFLSQCANERPIGYHALCDLDAAISRGGALKTEAGGLEFDFSDGMLHFKGPAPFSSAPASRCASFLLDLYREEQYFLKVATSGVYQCGVFHLVVTYDGDEIAKIMNSKSDASDVRTLIKIPLSFPFVFRNKREGDTIVMETETKTVNDVLTKAKIPEEKRHEPPLLEDRRGIGAIVLSGFTKETSSNVIYRKPLLGEASKIVYILLSMMKGDRRINV